MIPQDLLDILVCPRCHEPVTPEDGHHYLACSRCRLRFPVRDDIPVMLLDEAEPFATADDASVTVGNPAD
ncbi:MAG: Trm112 family protein [Deltaproteobacteria bacterium]|nr:Trm112 family protein [Candidatus Anaeroferrophillacea bacterium]